MLAGYRSDVCLTDDLRFRTKPFSSPDSAFTKIKAFWRPKPNPPETLFSSVESRLKDSVQMDLGQTVRVCVSVQVNLTVHRKFLHPTRLQHHLLTNSQQLLHGLSDVFLLSVECVFYL